MNLSLHLHFNGRCEQAFHFYQDTLGAKIGLMHRFAETPAADHVPTDWKDKIVHGNIELCGMDISGDDAQPEHYQPPTGFNLLAGFDSKEETESAFNALAQGGEIVMPLQSTFFSYCFGMLVDQFGVPWKLNCRQ